MRTLRPRSWWTAASAAFFASLSLLQGTGLASEEQAIGLLLPQPKIVWAELRTSDQETVTEGLALDTAAPVGKVSIEGGSDTVKSTKVRVKTWCQDDVSRCKQMRVEAKGKGGSRWAPYRREATIDLPNIEGVHEVSVELKDSAGNVSRASDSVLLDTAVPYIGGLSPWRPINRDKPTISAKIYDRGAGLDQAKTVVKLNGRNLPAKPTTKGYFNYRVPGGLPAGRNCVEIEAVDKASRAAQAKWCFQKTGIVQKYGKYFTKRKGKSAKKPWLIILHATAGKWPGDYRTLLGRGGRKVSVHYYVRKDGMIYQVMPDRVAAFHAGKSKWKGKSFHGSLNNGSLGIEIENRNNGKDAYTEAQIESVAQIVKTWQKRYDIPQRGVTSHAVVARGRKSDPIGFPWGRLWSLLPAT